jgi:hypothetical protein
MNVEWTAMSRVIPVAWMLALGACSAVAVDPLSIPLDRLDADGRRKAEHVLADVAALVPLEGSEVRSRPEVFDFLLDEMPFTGALVSAMGRGRWRIFRDPERPDPRVFHVHDPEGYRLRFELLLKEPGRRIYATSGSFDMGLFPALQGATLIVMRHEPTGAGVRTSAVVHVRVETPFYAELAKGLRPQVEAKVRERSGGFIQAARWVAEEAALRPAALLESARGVAGLDPSILDAFERRLLR